MTAARQTSTTPGSTTERASEATDDTPLGWLLAGAWRRTTTDGLTYGKVLTHLLAADAELGTGHGALLAQAFAARGIAA